MSWIIFIYMVILFLELSIGCSLIVWKCTASGADLECKLAIGGTITSIAIWLLVVLVCPCYMSRCEMCNMLDTVIQKCSHYFGQIRVPKPHTMYIENEVYLPTTVSLLENRQDDSVYKIEDTAKPQKAETGNFVLGSSDAEPFTTGCVHNASLISVVAKQMERKQYENVSDSQDVPLLSGNEQDQSSMSSYS